ncbi:MAG: hypothetical protein ABFC80_00190 [Coriobacteriales bacterium]|nr:hypothetical protein [Actinomycetes bacterium]
MRAYVCFDDTDILDGDRGTGKLVRWFSDQLPEGCSMWGVVRQQLLVHPDIPYTSHNSSACAVVDIPDRDVVPELIERAAAHVEKHMMEGSDPGLCVAVEGDPALERLIAFGRRAATNVVTMEDAVAAARGVHLSGHGGTDGGMIGAAAGVGLTAEGWAGRFIEYGALREFPPEVSVRVLETAGITVLPVDRNVEVPKPDDLVVTQDWLRPRLWGGRPALPVAFAEPGTWAALGRSAKQE